MKYHKQKFLHDPDNGQYGDCYRTALACILDMDRDDVPHFMGANPGAEELWASVDAWLRERGLKRFTVAWQGTLSEVLGWMKRANPNTVYLLAGSSPRGTSHQVIARDADIIHDPHPDGGGIVGPCPEDDCFYVDVLLPVSIHGQDVEA